jgi:4-amino-4-deoxy-L-arabinose transferase-like glycosyltransferase
MQLTVIFIVYIFFALIYGIAYRFAMNPDGTSVLRLAGYIAEGNFQQSVSSGYSPFFTWLVSPFIYIGFDGLTAARIAVALCGAGLLICTWFLAQRFDLPQNIRFIAVLVSTPLIAFWTIQFISPDVLFAALLLCYLYLVTEPDILNTRKLSFLCGIAAGFSYLAHHYTLPFFLVHFPVLLLTRGYIDKDKKGLPFKNILISWVGGVTGFFIIASLWIGIVSVKYEQLSISPKGGIAHAIMGPDDKDRRHPFFVGGLYKPRDPYAIHIFEDISDVKFETWSPFESKEYFIHQIKLIKINAVYILNHFVNQSPFFTRTFVICILVIIPIAFWLNPLNKRNKFLYAWVVITFSIYSSGFLLLIARSPRRFYALMLIFLLLSFHFMEELKYALRNIVSDRRKKILAFCLFIIIISAFAIKPGVNLMKSVKHIITVDQVNPYREIAEQINTIEFPSPYAIIRSSQKPTTDYYLTYFLNKPLLGRPSSKDVHGITKELEAAGGQSLLVFDNPEIVEELKVDRKYIHIASVKLNNSKRYEHVGNWIVVKHEITAGWDKEVNVFTLK